MKTALHQYRLADAECTRHSREQVARLVAAAKGFRVEANRWPYRLSELSRFADQRQLPLDELAFNQTTFASMSDGSLEIQYEFNCARFDSDHPQLTQHGRVRVHLDR